MRYKKLIGVKTFFNSNCYLCGNKGKYLYRNLKDRLFNAPGEWGFKRCTNRKCNLIWLNPKPFEKEISKLYKNYFTHEIKNSRPKNKENNVLIKICKIFYNNMKNSYLYYNYGYKIRSNKHCCNYLSGLIKFFPIKKTNIDFGIMYLTSDYGGKLLDIGCGNGSFIQRMKNLCWEVNGVDIDPIAVDIAKSRGLNVDLGTLEAQNYPDNHFDAITMSHIIEHLHDPLKTLQECKRILKKDKPLIIITPNIDSLGHKIFKEYWLSLDPPRHLYIFSYSSLSALVKRAGFKEISSFTTVRDANNILIASQNIKSTGSHKWGSSKSKFSNKLSAIIQLIEWILIQINRKYGEEIVFIIKK